MLAAVVAVSGLKERNRREEVGEGEFQDARTHARTLVNAGFLTPPSNTRYR